MLRYTVPALVLFVLGGFFLRGLYLNPGYVESPLIGKPAPEFSLPGLKDPALQVGDLVYRVPARA
jgi:cytochrome c biogenesis protein CcmG/thiol:disulfide interchange protein DsbE